MEHNFNENKEFKIEKEVFFPKEENLGGRPIEIIKLTIECFKMFCLLATTEKSKKIYKYYIKMEKIIIDYIKEYIEKQNNIIIQHQQQIICMDEKIIKEKELERHNVLLSQYGTAGKLIYIIKVKIYNDNKYIIKIGSSRYGILERYKEHKLRYETSIILDCFLVSQHEDFEKFLHHHEKIKPNKVIDLKNHENEHELFIIGESLSYNELKNIIITNIKSYDDDTLRKRELGNRKIELENEQFKLKIEHAKLLKDLNSDQLKILAVNSSNNNEISNKIDKLEQFNKSLLLKMNFLGQTIKSENIKATIGPKLLQINPSDFSIYKIYETVSELLKTDNQMRRPSINKAIQENIIFKNYRWMYLPRDINLDKIKQYIIDNIQPTHQLQYQKTYDYIAQLDKDKTEIINVFLDKKTASNFLGKCSSALDRPVQHFMICSGFYFRPYNLCPEELVKKYEEQYGKPLLYTKGVGQYDENNNLIKEYECKTYCFKELKISDKTFDKFYNKNIKYQDFYYKSMIPKLKHL